MSTQLHDSDLDLALARLVAEGVITSDQAAQVGALRDSYAAGHHAEAAAIRSRRGVVALAAVGGVLVAIGAITAVLSAWDSYSDAVQLALAWGATAAAVAAAVVVALRTPDGLPDLRGHERRGRAAVVGTLGLLAAGLAAGATALTMTVADAGGSRPELTVAMACWGAASVVVLVVLAVAPGPMATLPAWACSLGLALTGTALLAPAAGAGQRLAPVDVLLLVVAITLGMAWAVLGPRVARPAQLAEALGVGTWCGAALAAAVSWPEQFTWQERLDECAGLDPPPGCDTVSYTGLVEQARVLGSIGLAALLLLVVVGLAVFIVRGGWPWAAGGVLAATAATQILAVRTLGGAAAFVVAGLVLIGLSLAVGLRRRRRTG